MQAAWYTRNGDVDVLEVGELPTPEPGPSEVRVRLATSGINPSDVKSRRSRPLGDHGLIVPHSDGAGVIDAVGLGIPASRIGERVWLWNAQWLRPLGTAAQAIALPSEQAVRLPEGVDFDVGACLGIPLMTALHAVRLLGSVLGRTVLVTGAANAVGQYATQLLAQAGATVIGTVGSEEKAQLATQAGARHTLNYKRESLAGRLIALTSGRGVDAVVDMDFSSTAALLETPAVRPHSLIVAYGSNEHVLRFPFRAMMRNSIVLRPFLVYDLLAPDRQACIEGINALLERATLTHRIGARLPMTAVAEAHRLVEAGHSGKVLLYFD